MKANVRVLVVVDYLNHNSGVSSVVMNYYSEIDKSKIQMDFLLYKQPEKSILKYLNQNGSKVYALGYPVELGLPKYQKVIDQFFAEHQKEYQIVHLHIPNAAFIVLKAAKKYGIDTRIMHSHNSRGADGLVKKIRNSVLNRQGIFYANEYFACSKSAGRYLYGKKKLNKVTIIPNAISLEKFRYDQKCRKNIREQWNIPEKTLVLGHVGRFSEQKNHRFLIEIGKRLKEKELAFRLLFLGDGELKEQIRAQAKQAGVENNLIFAGVVSNPKEYMDAMDLFLLPSLYEGLPCVCVEAQANGLPCLISANVTKEVELSDYVQFLDISDADQWCQKIIEWSNIRKLEAFRGNYDCSKLMEYDIIVQAKILEEKYLAYGNSSDTHVNL